jgi:UrcA family protein
MNNKPMVMGLVALMVGAAAGTASAQSAREAVGPNAHVRYADLDLSNATDRTRLERRIALAADTLCGGAPAIGDFAATKAYRTCLQATIASSTPTIEQAARQQARFARHELAQASER